MNFYDIEFEDCYQITIKASYLGQQVINRLFYRANSPPFGGTLEGMAFDIASAWNFAMLPFQVDDLEVTEAVALMLFNERQQAFHVFTGAVGEDVGAPLPAFFGLQFRLIANDTRIRKGRKIVAGISEAMVDSNTWGSGYDVRVATAVAQLSASLLSHGEQLNPVLLSPANTRHTGDLISNITQAQAVGWSTQNSRKIGRGV